MSEEEGFLNRWSRRKQEAAKEHVGENEKVEQQPVSLDQPENPAQPPEEAFDISKLPPVDSITAATDIRSFLAKGVPAALTQAALRRAWSADPAIREYIGLSEYSWDFNAPGQFGFGELDPSLNVQEMVADMFGQLKKAAASVDEAIGDADSAAPKADSALTQDAFTNPVEVRSEEDDGNLPTAFSGVQSSAEIGDKSAQVAAATQQSDEIEDEIALPARRHGSALPS